MAKKASKKASKKTTKKVALTPKEHRVKKRKEKAAAGLTSADVVKTWDDELKSQVKLPRDEVYYRLFTGILDVDLNGVSSVGRRIQLIGKPNMGKSLLAYIIGGAAQRTCRICFTPIIPWMNDWEVYKADPKDWEKRLPNLDFEVKVTCSCGANDPMRVMLVDTEDCYDRYWSSLWGLMAHSVDTMTLEIDPDSQDVYHDIDGDTDGVRHTLFLVKPESSAHFESMTLPIIASGAIDLVIVDSLAQIAIQEDLDGYAKIASRARWLKRQLPLILANQLKARNNFGTRLTFIATNHLMSGPTANPKMNPFSASGGMAWGYTQDLNVDIVSSKSNVSLGDGGYKLPTVMRDVRFKIPKSKVHPGGREGSYRLYVDDHKKNDSVSYRAGESNEPEVLLRYLKELNDPSLYRVEMRGKTKSGYFLLGRVFKRVKDMVVFLKRRDVQFQLRPLIFAGVNEMSITEKMNIDVANYNYNPFPGEYMQEQISAREEKLGEHFFQVRVVGEQRRRDAGTKL